MSGARIGIISEGVEDQGVLFSILKAFGFDRADIIPIRPELSMDATDLNSPNRTIGTLQGVKNTCIGNDGERPEFEEFFMLDNNKNIIIHLDTAEIEQQDFDITKPDKRSETYTVDLRNSIISLIKGWLDGEYIDDLVYAISVEEIESWVLTAFEDRDTTSIVDCKGRLSRFLSRGNLSYKDLKLDPSSQKRAYFEAITKKKKFHKMRTLKTYCNNNKSLDCFVTELEEKIL